MKTIDSDKIEYVIAHLREPHRLLDDDFQEWLAQDDNFQIFDEIRRNREAWMYREFAQHINVGQEFEKCASRIRSHSRRIIYLWSSTAACVALLLSSLFLFTPEETTIEPLATVTVPVGKKCAELILADGKRVALDNRVVEIKDVQGTVVKNDTLSRLTYEGRAQSDGDIEYHTLKVPAGADYYVQLGDGTKVWLNCETTLKYPVNFAKNERKVFLDGEAYFEVNKAVDWPFIVATDKMDVQVTGTEFNVKSYAIESLIHTTLVRGSVVVNKQQLKPSQQFRMNKETQEINIQTVDTELYTGWVNGMFVFRNQRLEEVMADLARWYKMEVFYMSQAAKEIRFSGNLGRYETIDDLLQIVRATDKVSIVRKGNAVTVRIK